MGFVGIVVVFVAIAVVPTGLVRRFPVAPLLFGLGVCAFVYWYAAMSWNLWTPPTLFAYWHIWGISSMLLMISGGIGTAVYALVRGTSASARAPGEPCPACGYDLRGTPSGAAPAPGSPGSSGSGGLVKTCPECGAASASVRETNPA
jgi:hypothetical protein